MQVSLKWLNELVELSGIEAEQIAHELTMSGLEVEEIEEVKPQFTNIITARIEKIDAHPNSDRLHLVTINNGLTTKTVVCGAQNIKEGQIIPYASVGTISIFALSLSSSQSFLVVIVPNNLPLSPAFAESSI